MLCRLLGLHRPVSRVLVLLRQGRRVSHMDATLLKKEFLDAEANSVPLRNGDIRQL